MRVSTSLPLLFPFQASRSHFQRAVDFDAGRIASLMGWRGPEEEGVMQVKVPPTVVPCCLVSYNGRLQPDDKLGDVLSIVVRGEASRQGDPPDHEGRGALAQPEPWYLERVEVSFLMTELCCGSTTKSALFSSSKSCKMILPETQIHGL